MTERGYNTDIVRKVLEANLRRKMSDRPRKVFTAFANYEFEWTIKQAWNTVKVPIEPKIVLDDVSSKNSGDLLRTSLEDIDAKDRIITTDQLVVNKFHRFREKVSSLEEVQTLYNIKDARKRSLLVALENAVESGCIQCLETNFAVADNAGQVITASHVNRSSITDIIMAAKVKLEKAEVWDDVVLVVSPLVASLITTAKILNGTDKLADNVIQGYVGEYGGFQIYKSNFITEWNMYAFKPYSYNYVRQLTEIDITKAPAWFYYNIMGQIVHGGKVFEQNVEQLVKVAGTIDTDPNTPDTVKIASSSDDPVYTQAVTGQ